MSLRLMQNELQQWGQWARPCEHNCGLRQYVSPSHTLMELKREKARQLDGCVIHLNDNALMGVDFLVGQLKRSKPMLFEMVKMHYLKGWTVKYIADRSGVSRPAIDKYLLMAETWLDCRYETLCERELTA